MKTVKIKYFIFIFLFIIIIPSIIFAKDEITIETSQYDLELNDEFVLTAKISSDRKLYALTATLSYDESVFEAIDDRNFENDKQWSEVIYNPENNKFGLINKSGELSDTLLSVRLRVKEDAKVGTTSIYLTNISASDGTDKVTFEDSSVDIFVSRDANNNEAVPINNKFTPVKVENTVIEASPSKNIPIIIVVSVLLIISIISSILIYMFNARNKKQIIICLCIVSAILISILIALVIITNKEKQDINDDGKIDYEDAKQIIKYIIEIDENKKIAPMDSNEETQNNNTNNGSNNRNPGYSSSSTSENTNNNSYNNTSENKRPNGDVNNDGKVDIEDAGDITQNVTEKTKYKVTLSEDSGNKYYVARNQEINLNFKADVKPSETIKSVVIDNKEYSVIKNASSYTVVLNAPDTAGVHEFNFSKVVLDNNKEVNASLKINVEVLKTIPTASTLKADNETNGVSFTLNDPDKALINGQIELIDYNSDVVFTKDIKNESDCNFNFEFEEDKEYKVVVTGSYDLDSNVGGENNYTDVPLLTGEVVMMSEYDFEISNVEISKTIHKGESAIITFESSNSTKYPIKSVVIGGKTYDVSIEDDNHYKLALPENSICGEYNINIEEIILSNSKYFDNGKDFNVDTLAYCVLKDVPTINDIKVNKNAEEKTVKVTYKISDTDSTLNNLEAVLSDKNNKEVSKTDNVIGNEEITFTYNDEGITPNLAVQFFGNYDLGAGYVYEDELLGTGETAGVAFNECTISNKYPKKGEEIYLYYYVDVPEKTEPSSYPVGITDLITGVTINGLNYSAKQEKINNRVVYTVNFKVPDEDGVVEAQANRVIFFNGRKYWLEPISISFDVLKDKPWVENFEVVSEDYETGEVTFSFDVCDDNGGFISGEMVLGDQKVNVGKGSNTVTFSNIKQDENFKISILGNYDLDSNTIGDEKDNYKENDEIFSISYGLFDSDTYKDIKIENINATSQNDNSYFEKNEDVKLNFDFTGIDEEIGIDLAKVVILGKEYNAIKNEDSTYTAVMDGFSNAGTKNFEINEVVLSNGKKVELNEPATVKIEILKDALKTDDFRFSIDENNINLNVNIEDPDDSLVGNIVLKAFDEDDKFIEEHEYNGSDITLNKSDDLSRYYIKGYATYDRDTNTLTQTDNKYENQVVLDEVISLDKHYLELKEITNVELLKNNNGNLDLADKISKEELEKDLQNYVVKITMSNMPVFYSNIKEVLIENNHLILILDYEYAVLDDGNVSKNLRIDYGEIKDGYASNEVRPESFEEFIERVKANPDQTFTLTHDLDASGYETNSNTMIDIDFTGTLDGAGYTIKNLTKPLFNNIQGGTVKNLKIQNVKLPSVNARGALANTTNGATISGILIDMVEKSNGESQVGSLIGTATNTNIEESKVTNFVINSQSFYQQVGGLVGASQGSTIKNCYVTGTLNAWNYRGGFIGFATNTTVENCYAKVTVNGSWGGNNLASGFVYNNDSNGVLRNNISFSTGSIDYILTNNFKEATNNYQIVEENAQPSTKEGINNITKNQINKEFFVNQAKFDEDIWDLDNTSAENLPPLKREFKSVLGSINSENNDLYDKNKELLYKNLSRLTPFYDSDSIIKTGASIDEDNILYSQEIKHIIPIDSNGDIVTYLTKEDYTKISKVKVIFSNNTIKEYNVRFDKLYGMVVGYRITDLKIDYTFNHYMIDSESKLVSDLVKYLSDLDYTKNLDTLTTSEDSRLYRDYYNEVTKKELKEFVLKYLSNNNTLTLDTNSSDIEKDLEHNNKLKKALYVYNYFKRWYSVEIGGIMLNDLVLFNSQGFNAELNVNTITNKFFENESNFATNSTSDAYNNTLSKYTGIKNITRFLEYFVEILTDDTPDEWFAKEFKGNLTEVKVEGRDDLEYTMWDHLSHEDNTNWAKWHNFALVLLTLPENSTYIISSPTQFLIGSQRTYIVDPNDPEQSAKLNEKIKDYAQKISNYFATATGFIKEAKYFNDIHGMQLDQRYTLDSNGKSTYQSRGVTEEAFHKNFNDAINMWKEMDGNAATSNGTHILWNAYSALNAYDTWSHETAHNIDARLYQKNNGRRFDAGGEDYSDGNLAQRWGNGDITMNLTYNFTEEERKQRATNWTIDRINTPDKIKDFYGKVFESIYILDYLEAQAFLQLTPEEQARLAVQVSYPDDPTPEDPNDTKYKPSYRKRLKTRYTAIGADKYRDMDLKDMEDLYDNRIVMYPGIIMTSIIDNRYGTENIFRTRWYQPHNDEGRPDSYSLKFFAYEMLGYAGYDEGYMEYYSNIHSKSAEVTNEKGETVTVKDYKTDLMALQTITKDPEMTFKKYKMMRFDEVKDNLEYIQYINVNDVFEEFYYALKEDAKVVEEAETKEYASDTDRNNALSKARAYTNSTQVRKDVYYKLKEDTNDFVSQIYDKDNPHEVKELKP